MTLRRLNQCVLLLAVLLASWTLAAPVRGSQAGCDSTYCFASSDLDISLGLGYGKRTNPLHLSDDRTLILLPDVAWYGDSFYLDNTEVGYQWIQESSFALETFFTLNKSNRDFQDDHASSFNLDGSPIFNAVEEELTAGESPVISGDPDDGENSPDSGGDVTRQQQNIRLSPDHVADRDFAIDFGVRAHWYQGDNEWTAAVFHDSSDTYKGARAKLQYRNMLEVQQWKFVTSVSLEWKSADLLDYYYGIDERDLKDDYLNNDDFEAQDFYYDAGSGWFSRIGITANRKITDNWRWLMHVSYNHLPDAIVDSPLVDKDYTITTFAGVTYRF